MELDNENRHKTTFVLAGGRFCKKAEQNYSLIEGEEPGRHQVLHHGMQKALFGYLSQVLGTGVRNQSLANVANPRLARIKERTLW